MTKKSPARILFVEDMPADAELAKREIRKSGLDFSSQRVDTQEAFLIALRDFQPEIIVSDYTMPTFDGRQALALAQQWDPTVPVIILTGSINEETAVDCLRSGAMDYIIKEHIVRLPFSVREALEKRKAHLARESAERALRKSESSLQAILHSTADGILAVSAENKVLFANKRFTMMWNIPQDIVATSDDSLLLKTVLGQLADPEGFVQEVQRLYSSNEESFDSIDFKDGRVFERSSRPLMEQGTVQGRVWSFRDVTDRKRAEEALKESEGKYHRLVEESPDAITIYRGGTIVFANSATVELLRMSSVDQLLGRAVLDFVHPDSRAIVAERMKEVSSRPRTLSPVQERLVRVDGSVVDVEMRAIPTTYENQPAVQLLARDITERKRMEEAILYEQSLLRAILDNVPDHVYFKDKESRFLKISRSQSGVFGLGDPTQAVGKTDSDFFSYEHSQQALKDEQNIIQSGIAIVNIEEKETWPDGRETWVSTTKMPLQNAGGQIIGTFGISKEITERKHAEQALRENEEFFRLLFTASPDAILLFDPNSTLVPWEIVDCNEVACRMNGYTREELIGKSIDMLNLSAATQEERDSYRKQVEEKGLNCFETVHRHRDGHIFPIEVAAAVVVRGGRQLLLGIDRDITERKRAEEALRESEERYRGMFENVQDVYYESSLDGTILELSPSIAMWSKGQYHREELIGKSMDDFYDQPKQRDALLAELQARGRVTDFEIMLKNRDGSLFACSVSASIQNDKRGGKQKIVGSLRDVSERRKAEETRLLLTTALESTANGVAITDLNGDLVWINKAFSDMTGYSRAEVLGRNPKFLKSGKQDGAFYKRLWETISAGHVWHGELINKKKDGGLYIDEMMITPLKNSDGNLKNFIAVNQDVTERRRGEELLKNSEERHKILFESAPDGMFLVDLKGTFKDGNKAAEKIIGYNREELVGKNFFSLDLVGKADALKATTLLAKSAVGFSYGPSEFTLNRKNGTQVSVEIRSFPVKIEGKTQVLGIARDITERKRSEERINLLAHTVKSVAECISITDMNDVILFVNDAFLTTYGYAEGEILGKKIKVTSSPSTPPEFLKEMQRAARMVGWHGEMMNRKKDGSEFRISLSTSIVRDPDNQPIALVGVATDITERKRVEEALKSEKALMDSLMDTVPDSIYFKDRQCRFLRINRKMMQSLNLTDASQAVGKTDIELFGEEFGRETFDRDSRLMETGKPIIGLVEARETKDHQINWTLTTKIPLSDNSGRVVGLVGITREINDLMKTHEALRDNEQRLKVALTCADIAVFNQDKNLRYTWMFNPQLGFLPDDVVGKTDADLFPQANLSRITSMKENVLKNGVGAHDELLISLDAMEVLVLLSVEPLRDSTGTVVGLTGAMIDISERKRAEISIKESEERYKNLFEQNLAATFISTPSGKLLDCNPSFVNMFGFKSYEEALAANMSSRYADQRNRDLVFTSLREHKTVENLELRMVKTDNTEMFIIANLVAKFDEQGQLVQKTGYLIDDTKRHGLEKELIQSQKLESLGILAGGIAHDFNNILGILMGHVSLLDRIQDNPELHKTSLGAIDTALKRGTGLVRQLLTFARKTDVEFAPLLINDIVKELIKLLRETLPRTIEIVADLNPKLPTIVADGGQIHQVLLNLCVNAKDAMHAGGRLRIQTNLVDGSLLRHRFPNVVAEKYVLLEVQDSGTGMDEATKARIFEPFFTTKELGKGTGLGLAVVFGVVQTHKGFIDVESEIGKGSAFRIYLPAEETHPEVKISRARFEDARGGSETILIVEDEVLLYETTKMTLASKGYAVLYARDGLEALDVYRKHHKDIGLVLTDMDLPKLGGEKLIETLAQINPNLRIVFASGYVDPEVKEKVLQLGAKAFLAKPYDPITLLGMVRRVLDAGD
jgi:PAS domain S-box-containing protein